MPVRGAISSDELLAPVVQQLSAKRPGQLGERRSLAVLLFAAQEVLDEGVEGRGVEALVGSHQTGETVQLAFQVRWWSALGGGAGV
jgi:hypothetical protein